MKVKIQTPLEMEEKKKVVEFFMGWGVSTN